MNNQSITILYIEDNAADVVLVQEMLADEPNLICVLENSPRLAAGMERLEAGGIDLTLLDLSLPDSHGLETFLALKNKMSGMPVIVMTGTDDEALAVKAVQAGAQDYLVKRHLDTNLLVRAIRYAIEREKLLASLRQASEQIKTLKGFIPICASCKNVRDDKGFWHQVESYISKHSDAEFSHGICPDCAQKLYPDFLTKRGTE
ncbi:MAG: response regulator [Deltaproteobacteria bacterium]|nr:response regulator [Deltaproteobacteria bacterium]